jgi:hypothetical protein
MHCEVRILYVWTSARLSLASCGSSYYQILTRRTVRVAYRPGTKTRRRPSAGLLGLHPDFRAPCRWLPGGFLVLYICKLNVSYTTKSKSINVYLDDRPRDHCRGELPSSYSSTICVSLKRGKSWETSTYCLCVSNSSIHTTQAH